jgi:hypothetical protein
MAAASTPRKKAAFPADAEITLGKGQAVQLAKGLGHGREIAFEDDNVAGP